MNKLTAPKQTAAETKKKSSGTVITPLPPTPRSSRRRAGPPPLRPTRQPPGAGLQPVDGPPLLIKSNGILTSARTKSQRFLSPLISLPLSPPLSLSSLSLSLSLYFAFFLPHSAAAQRGEPGPEPNPIRQITNRANGFFWPWPRRRVVTSPSPPRPVAATPRPARAPAAAPLNPSRSSAPACSRRRRRSPLLQLPVRALGGRPAAIRARGELRIAGFELWREGGTSSAPWRGCVARRFPLDSRGSRGRAGG